MSNLTAKRQSLTNRPTFQHAVTVQLLGHFIATTSTTMMIKAIVMMECFAG